jgi:predicted RNA-binding protein YlxR (DUF448 family)
MLRLVKTAEGQVFLDETGKKPGRGLYVCPGEDCLAQALKKGRLDKAAGAKVGEAVLERLREKVAHEPEP